MAHYEEVQVSGFGDFCRAVEDHGGKTILAYLKGSKDAEGCSWCPDCVQAEPVVLEALKHISENAVFIYCQVGERPDWKDLNNEFKKNLTMVPTLLNMGHHRNWWNVSVRKPTQWKCCSQRIKADIPEASVIKEPHD